MKKIITLVAASALTIIDFALTNAHSWVACTDYRGDVNFYEQEKCMGFPRRWSDRGVLNEEQPYGYQIAVESPPPFHRAFAGDICDQRMHSANEWRSGYSQNFPHATYEQGNTYCLAWSLQNHATAPTSCNNPHQKSDAASSDSLFLYVSNLNPSGDPSQEEFYLRNINQVAGFATDCDPTLMATQALSDGCQLGLEKHSEPRDCKGFQRSPQFCKNTGSSMGTGCFYIPPDMAPGHYVGQWYWDTVFDRGTNGVQTIAYKTCFDFVVVEQASKSNADLKPGTKGQPDSDLVQCRNNVHVVREAAAGMNPSPPYPPIQSSPSPNPGLAPTENTDSDSSQCSSLYERCGGNSWQGATCCQRGAVCFEKYENWFECIPEGSQNYPPSFPPSPLPTPLLPSVVPTSATCSVLHDRCGGIGWQGPKCCRVGLDCVEIYPKWFQCTTSDRSTCSPVYGRCGGPGWSGPTCCQRESQCVEQNPDWFVCHPV